MAPHHQGRLALTQKLKALETYHVSSRDVDGREADLYRELIDEDSRKAQRIHDVLRDRISTRH